MATIFEKFDSRESTVGPENPSVDLLYGVTGTEDDAQVRTLVQATVPAFYAGLIFQHYRINHVGGGVWDVTVHYGKREPKETGQSSFSFDTSGGTQKITQSLQTIARYAAAGQQAPDFKGAVNVSGDNVEGVEITLPVYNWTETYYLPDVMITGAYKSTLFFMTGRVNILPFRGLQKGEVLFLGSSGSKRGSEDWEINFKFAGSPNVFNLTIGDITGINKEGWQYLWIRYEDDEDQAARKLIKKPTAVYVEQLYHYGDLSLLGIGL